ncbi:MAG: hypothetical protein QOG17_1884 [Gammaproteobacteria bacterium]|jgi:hypothetical protein|nr:hypothetical protein [Gammaproteobacteria bacterium]
MGSYRLLFFFIAILIAAGETLVFVGETAGLH